MLIGSNMRDVEEIAREIVEIAHPMDCAIEGELRVAIVKALRAERERLPSFDESSTEFWRRFREDEFNGEEDAWLQCYDWLVERMK